MADLGRAALFVSLGLMLYATLAGAWAARTRKRRLADSAANALVAALGSTAVAAAVLVSALVGHDFSFTYVAEHTSTALSTGY
jgi:cytochrome c biogenesis factor